MFDAEIILRAVKRGARIQEFPIAWRADLDSRLSQMKMPSHILTALIKIKQALAKV